MLSLSDAAQIIRCWGGGADVEWFWLWFFSSRGGCVRRGTNKRSREMGNRLSSPQILCWSHVLLQWRRKKLGSEWKCQRVPAAFCFLSSTYINCTHRSSRENKVDRYSQPCRVVRPSKKQSGNWFFLLVWRIFFCLHSKIIVLTIKKKRFGHKSNLLIECFFSSFIFMVTYIVGWHQRQWSCKLTHMEYVNSL